ncbi:hypothetical protein [Kitasatospora sp. GAS204B]|uniref:hypothetical protein n=1 Tax=unclassified Kitasatospora TaxID=2633591 RepID=UPI002474C487|nr:hypothetical protein [Kitasatospora sp. GAS204B]MDH6116693.1 hypothetical protein [Kitasatospora sp. GAS204B]
MGSTERLAALHVGQVDGPSLVAELREALLLAPTGSGELLAADAAGVRWLYAFTDEPALARFASARGLDGEVDYLTVYGSRLLGCGGGGPVTWVSMRGGFGSWICA